MPFLFIQFVFVYICDVVADDVKDSNVLILDASVACLQPFKTLVFCLQLKIVYVQDIKLILSENLSQELRLCPTGWTFVHPSLRGTA